jgi:type IV pilus assembly protein PilZ
MDEHASLLEAFDGLNERKRRDPDSLSKLEKARWRMMRCQIEEALFQQTRDPAKDTREFLRVPISMKVRYQHEGMACERYLTVLGEGGLFISALDPAPKGVILALEGLPAGRPAGRPTGTGESFRVKGEVVWSNVKGPENQHGMGIKFIDLSQAQKELIHTLVDDTVRQGLLERRRYARIDTRLEIKLEHGLRAINLQTHDLSLGGMFVACDLPVQVDSTLRFELRVPGGLPAVKGTAKAKHLAEKISQGQRKGVGVSFENLGVENKGIIRNYMAKRVTGEIRHAADEPRKHARLMRRIKLRFQAVNGFGTTDARDISGGGVFMQSRQPPPLESRVELGLIDPATLKTLDLAGKVVRVIRSNPQNPHAVPGVGLAFDEISQLKQEQLDEFLRNLVNLETTVYSPKKR